jgi:hypothetical protein
MELTHTYSKKKSQDMLLCAQQFIECVGTYLILEEQKKSQVLEVQHSQLQDIYHQSLVFFYRSVFLLLSKPNLQISERSQMWDGLVEQLNSIQLTCYLWQLSNCPLQGYIQVLDVDFCSIWFHMKSRMPDITSEQLGSLHEHLLEKIPQWNQNRFVLQNKKENKRKSSGSYYTPKKLVDIVLQATLRPTITKILQQESSIETLLQIRICDPSCGTGNFLLAAADILCDQILSIQYGCSDVDTEIRQKTMVKVIEHCIYGVDLNPLSIALCRISLWMKIKSQEDAMDVLERFAQRNIKCGNSLLGVNPKQMEEGIKKEYFDLVKGQDDKKIRNQIVKKNRSRNENQSVLEALSFSRTPKKQIANLLLASTLWPKIEEGTWLKYSPSNTLFMQVKKGKAIIPEDMQVKVTQLCEHHQFFHWHLEFEDVFEQGGFDVVVGNPPYLDSEYIKRHTPRQRMAIRNLYRSAMGNWDLFIPFTELAIRITKTGGRQSFVTPNKMIGADYAKALQQIFFANSIQEIHDFSHMNTALFDGANVAVVAVVIQKCKPQENHDVIFYQYKDIVGQEPSRIVGNQDQLKKLPSGYISFPITCSRPSLLQWLDRIPKISDIAHVSDGLTTGEAYIIREMLCRGSIDDYKNHAKIKLINTGTVDPYLNLWSTKSIRYLGFQDSFPVIDATVLQEKFPKRYAQAQQEKIIVAGMSNRIEAVVVPSGFLCGKSAIQIIPREGICPFALAGFLNGQDVTILYRGLFSMRGMGGNSMNIGPRQIERLPIPIHFYAKSEANRSMVQVLSKLGTTLHQSLDSKQREKLLRKVDAHIETMMNIHSS